MFLGKAYLCKNGEIVYPFKYDSGIRAVYFGVRDSMIPMVFSKSNSELAIWIEGNAVAEMHVDDVMRQLFKAQFPTDKAVEDALDTFEGIIPVPKSPVSPED